MFNVVVPERNSRQVAVSVVSPDAENKSKPTSAVKVLGKLPKAYYGGAVAKRETGKEKIERERRNKRFTVEALETRLREHLGLSVKRIKDLRGACPGGLVSLVIGNETRVDSYNLPVEQKFNEVIYTEHYVWEIIVEKAALLRPRAGSGTTDLDKTVRFIRREINGY